MLAVYFPACYHVDMARSINPHKPDCRCVACVNRGRGETVTLGVRVPPELAAWVREQGGVAWVRALIERERAAQG